MDKEQLSSILSSEYDRDNWVKLLRKVFKASSVFAKPQDADLPKENDKIWKSAYQLGTFSTYDDFEIAVFEIDLFEDKNLERNRVELRNLLKKYYKQTDGIFAVYKQQKKWRFSFISKLTDYDLENDEWIEVETEPKRYTYLLGEDEIIKTPVSRFLKVIKNDRVGFSDIKEAFSVEALNKEFFKKYKEHYNNFWKYLADKDNGYRELLIDSEKDSEDLKTKPIRDFTKKMLGRIVFLHFLQKKGWMGCPITTSDWGNGDPKFMQHLFENFENKERFYSSCLVHLFFSTLNTKRENDLFRIPHLKGKINGSRIPYLNGGLFDPEKNESTLKIDFPVHYFQDLLDFFEQYNFTIDENSPFDQDVGIDPEMLGNIFENLLEENREKGAFYTPKEVVQFMCKESLIEYLSNFIRSKKDVEYFIKTHSLPENFQNSDIPSIIDKKLDEIKVCDPAIGSGAFPIGMLQQIYEAKRFIYPHLNNLNPFNPGNVKRQIIQNSIYGVDIEKGAVDIAQLRFWLSLVVEELNPEPLPNLDYKIMQGDSLLEQYEEIDLSRIAFTQNKVTVISDLFSGTVEEPKSEYEISDQDFKSFTDLIKGYFEVEVKSEKTRIHRQIDNVVREHIDKSLEFFENKLLIQIAEIEKKLDGKVQKLKSKKDEYRRKSAESKQIKKIQQQIEKISDSRKELVKIEETEERPYFLWHLYFMDVFEKGGFDVMIGNPPYIQLQTIKDQANKYEKVNYKTFTRTGDIYSLFYEQGFRLLKRDGVLTYITSNKWMRAGYGKVLREFFTTVDSHKIINLGPNVFHSATVDTNIYIGKRKAFSNNVVGTSIRRRDTILDLKEDDLIPLPDVNEEAWVVLDEDELLINEAFKKLGTPLSEWNLKINFGIKTGFNKAFIIDEKTRNELIKKDPKAEEIIKPILRGREIERFIVDWKNSYLINIHNGVKEIDLPKVEIEDYPNIKIYLSSPELWDGVRKRYDQGDTPYNLRNCAYLKEFEKEKIIWKRIGSIMRFAYSDDEMYCLDSTCIATGEKIKYLTAVLNSKAGLYQLFKTSPQTGTGDQIISVQALEPFLAPYPEPEIEEKFNNLVDIILFIKSWNKSKEERILEALSEETVSRVFEDVVDHMVYEMYFSDHMKEKEIDILKLIDFPIISKIKGEEEKKVAIRDTYMKLTEKGNPIRNRMLLAFTRSPKIIKKINDTLVK